VKRTLSRRLALLARDVEPEQQQPGLPWDEQDVTDAELPDALLAARAPANIGGEIEILSRLVSLAGAAADCWSKVDVIRQLLRRTREQMLVFSEFRDVALSAAEALRDVSSSGALHGGLSVRERGDLVRAFNDGRIRVLVATDAAGEGLNLQARCRLVVNLELPWTPRRLEQRIGRVDRLGQARRVHALHLVHRDSFEGKVIARLERRRSLAQARTPDRPLEDLPTAAAVERRLRTHATRGAALESPAGVYASRPGTAGHLPCRSLRVVLLFAAALVGSDGKLAQRELVALIVTLPRRAGAVLSRRLVRLLVADQAVQSEIARELQRRVMRNHEAVSAFAAALERRCGECLASLERNDNQLQWQGSLFDRRAEEQAGLHHSQRRQLGEWLERKRASASALRTLSHTPPRVRAAWLAQ
jgi:hypothetical protein